MSEHTVSILNEKKTGEDRMREMGKNNGEIQREELTGPVLLVEQCPEAKHTRQQLPDIH